MAKLQNRILFSILSAIVSTSIVAQTTFTESAAAYGVNIGTGKDGGHAWADYDLDGDYDLVINTNGNGYLLRNDGGTFTDVTAALAPDFNTGSLERTALFVDFNNDGYPDIFRNDHNNIKIYLQHPATNIFGNGLGGTTPNQHITTLTDGMNTEAAGALDYDGDGDLDLFVDNHNFGIDILQNDGAGNFTHVTRKIDSPNPPYNVGDPTTWPLGLVQDATDGDYGSATDFNNDGWVDVVARKRNQVDLFTNLGGTFGNEIEIDDANNSNKGAVGFYDFDNDGDFDLYWTESTTNQIHRNNGDGTWTALGAATGIPTSFSGQMEGLACGDVDNDGDIDIYLGNGGTGSGQNSKLYLNQINNGGGAMTFIDSGLTFNNRNEGCTFIDIDTDGDLDLYVNKNGANNELWINNLGVAPLANHLYIDIIEDRDAFGLINTEQRFGVGATATILDCNGNVISGIREVNGGYGHGTQEPGVIHFGLPGGPNTPIVVEISYPRTTTGRIVVREELIPANFNNGFVNIVTILPTSGNQAPIANDDIISTTENVAVTFDPLVNNGNGVDSDPDSDPIAVISITQPANGTAVLNGDGTITYTPDSGFFGNDPFTYTLEDDTTCTLVNAQSIGNVIMTVNRDTDDDGVADIVDLDDDNDGILDTVEDNCSATETLDWESASYGWAGNTTSNSYLVGTTTVDIVATSNGSTFKLEEKDAPHGGISPFEKVVETKHNPDSSGDLLTVTFTFSNDVKDFQISLFDIDAKIDNWQDQVTITGYLNGSTVSSNIVGSADNTVSGNTITGNVETPDTNVGSGDGNVDINFSSYIDTFVIEYGPGPLAKSNPDEDKIGIYDFSFLGCTIADTDGDGTPDSLDTDSDGDGCGDADEAYFGLITDADPDNDGLYGTGTPSVDTDGLVLGAGYNSVNSYYTNSSVNTCEDNDSDGIPDGADLDDDNDGILDTVEDACAVTETLDWDSSSYNWPENATVRNFTVGSISVNMTAASNGSSFTMDEKSTPQGGLSPVENVVWTEHEPDSGSATELTTITYTFGSAINNFQTSIFDIDAKSGDYQDKVTVTGYLGAVPVLPTIVGSANNTVSGNSITGDSQTSDTGSSSGDANADITFTSPIDSFVVEYGSGTTGLTEKDHIGLYDFSFSLCSSADVDNDGIINSLDLDSDGDGCFDSVEAGFTDLDNDGILGTSPVTVDANGQVTGQGGYTTPADLDTNSTFDFLEDGPDTNSNGIADGCEADLELTKVVDNATPSIGDTITFTLTIVNIGPSQASSIQVRDVLPAGLASIVATPSTGTYTIGTGLWDLNTTMDSGDAETLVITAEITPLCGIITNMAEIINSSIADSDSTPNNGG